MRKSFLTSQGTLNIAHRGASGAAPENTLAAFRRARELGADGIELDARLCADNVPVVIHDATVDRTTNGTGRVEEMTLTQLKQLDAGAWFGRSFVGERIPTLEETLAAVGEELLLNIELKGNRLIGDRLAREVTSLIERRRWAAPVLLSSFNPLDLRYAQRLAPRIPTGLLYMWGFSPRIAQCIAPRPYTALHPEAKVLSKNHLDWIQRQDHRAHVWTVDEPMAMQRFIGWGVDGIITNRPGLLHDILEAAS